MTHFVDILVLAAGKSERMGPANKLILPVAGQSLLQRVLSELQKVPARLRVIVTGHEHELITSHIPPNGFVTVYNALFEKGMTSSIQCGIKTLDEFSAGVMIIPADLPGIKAAELEKLVKVFDASVAENPKTIVAAADKGVQKNPVIFSAYYYNEIIQHDQPNGCKKLVENYSDHLTLVEIQHAAFFLDVDTPTDYKQIQA